MRAINQAPYIMIVANSLMQENCRVNEERLHSHGWLPMSRSNRTSLIVPPTILFLFAHCMLRLPPPVMVVELQKRVLKKGLRTRSLILAELERVLTQASVWVLIVEPVDKKI